MHAAGLFLLWLASPVTAQDAPLAAFVQQLKAEAAGVADLASTTAAAPRFLDDYPHPDLPAMDPAVAGPLVLHRLQGPLADDPYADAYIRWHLMPIVEAYLDAAFDRWLTSSTLDLSPLARPVLAAAFQSLPSDCDQPWREETWYEPRELDRQRQALRDATRVRVGVPPYDRYVYEERALEFAAPAERPAIEQALARMKKIEAQLTRRTDPAARQFNDRRRSVNQMLEHQRGQLLDALLRTGDPAALRMIGDEIARQARRRQYAAIELMHRLYDALDAGRLLLYDDQALAALRRKLEQTAREQDQSVVYLVGGEPPEPWIRPNHHHFADLAFHLLRVLDSPAALQACRYAALAQPPPPIPAPRDRVSGAQLTTARVQAALDAAISQLDNPSPDNLHLRPRRVRRLTGKLRTLMSFERNKPEYQAFINESGNHALLAWAMLACGRSYQDPLLGRRISFVLASDSPFLFDRAMRLRMLANLSREPWQPWFDRDFQWLAEAYDADPAAALASEYGPTGPGDDFNNAAALYGALALGAVEWSGQAVPQQVWQAVDAYFRAQQHDPDPDAAAGWSVGLIRGDHALKDNKKNRAALEISPALTAAAAATLALTERRLHASQLTDADAADRLPHLPRALDWLDAHFQLDAPTPGVNRYFHLWNLQRLAHARGLRTLGGVDLFRDVVADVLNHQRPDGTWEDESFKTAADRRWTRPVSTAYAMLYLSDAVNHAVAVGKIRFAGRWNNRPHDLWNFVERASDAYESRTVWQVVDLSLPVEALIESPLLYLSTDEPFELTEAQIDRLRACLRAGAMLLLNGESSSPAVGRSFDQLIAALELGCAERDVPADHPFFSLHSPVKNEARLRMVDNGVRPLVVRLAGDPGRAWQTHPRGDSPAFDLLNNIYLYAVGLNVRRTRLDSDRLAEPAAATARSIEVAQLIPALEPAAMEQLGRFCAAEHQLDVRASIVGAAELADHRVAILSVPAGHVLSDGDARAIRDWLAGEGAGRQLWLDAAGGSPGAVEAMRAALWKIEAGAMPQPLPGDDPIVTGTGIEGGYDNTRVGYRAALLRRMGPMNSPRLQSVAVAGREQAIIVSEEDLACGLAGLAQWEILGYDAASARKLVANALLSAAREQAVGSR